MAQRAGESFARWRQKAGERKTRSWNVLRVIGVFRRPRTRLLGLPLGGQLLHDSALAVGFGFALETVIDRSERDVRFGKLRGFTHDLFQFRARVIYLSHREMSRGYLETAPRVARPQAHSSFQVGDGLRRFLVPPRERPQLQI